MEEIDLKELGNYFKSRSFILIIITILFAIAGCIYGGLIKNPKYKATTSIVLINESNVAFTNGDLTLNQNLIVTYTEIIKSKKILNEAIKNLDLSYKYGELYNMVSVNSTENSQMIRISTISPDPLEAKLISDEISNIFKKEITQIYKISNIKIYDEAEISDFPYNINVIKDTFIFMLIGLVLSSGVIFIIYYFDRTIKNSEQVEQRLKLPILGMIEGPEISRNKKIRNFFYGKDKENI